ncbi:hypothetical protein Tco_0739545 [Tanacetum coccineum]
MYNISCITKVNGLRQPTYGNPIFIFAELFGVSLKSYKDIDDFTKGIELGKYPVWSELTREKCKEVLDTIGDIWDSLVEESVTRANFSDPVVSKSSESVNPTFGNNIPSKVAPSDPIVQSVYIHEQPSSYVGAAEGSKMEPSKPKANIHSLCLENLCDGAKFSIPGKVVCNTLKFTTQQNTTLGATSSYKLTSTLWRGSSEGGSVVVTSDLAGKKIPMAGIAMEASDILERGRRVMMVV